MTIKKLDILKAFENIEWIEIIQNYYVAATSHKSLFRPAFTISLYRHKGMMRLSGGFGVFCPSFETTWRQSIGAQAARDDRGLPMSMSIENWSTSVINVERLYTKNQDELNDAILEIRKLFDLFPEDDQGFLKSIQEESALMGKPVGYWFHLENPLNHTNLYSNKSIAFLRFLCSREKVLFKSLWTGLHTWQRDVLAEEIGDCFEH